MFTPLTRLAAELAPGALTNGKGCRLTHAGYTSSSRPTHDEYTRSLSICTNAPLVLTVRFVFASPRRERAQKHQRCIGAYGQPT